MAINGVTSFSSYHVCSGSGIDAEWERIQRRLKEYLPVARLPICRNCVILKCEKLKH